MVSLGVCNARYAGMDVGKYSWNLRRKRLANLIHHLNRDIWCFQELSVDMQTFLADYLPGYEFFRAKSKGKVVAWNTEIHTATETRALAVPPTVSVPLVQFDNSFYVASIHNIVKETGINAAQQNAEAEHFKGLALPIIAAGDYNNTNPQIPGLINAKDQIEGANEDYNSAHGWRKQKRTGKWIDHIMISPTWNVDDLSLILTSIEDETDHNILIGTFS